MTRRYGEGAGLMLKTSGFLVRDAGEDTTTAQRQKGCYEASSGRSLLTGQHLWRMPRFGGEGSFPEFGRFRGSPRCRSLKKQGSRRAQREFPGAVFGKVAI